AYAGAYVFSVALVHRDAAEVSLERQTRACRRLPARHPFPAPQADGPAQSGLAPDSRCLGSRWYPTKLRQSRWSTNAVSLAYRFATTATNSSRAAMLIR